MDENKHFITLTFLSVVGQRCLVNQKRFSVFA